MTSSKTGKQLNDIHVRVTVELCHKVYPHFLFILCVLQPWTLQLQTLVVFEGSTKQFMIPLYKNKMAMIV